MEAIIQQSFANYLAKNKTQKGAWMITRRPMDPANNNACWPRQTEACCYWCCHGFDGVPVPLPLRLSKNNDFFLVKKGVVFCSFSCAKAHIVNQNLPEWPLQCELLQLIRKRVAGKIVPIAPAPHRSRLRMFGGDMPIDAFRAGAARDAITETVAATFSACDNNGKRVVACDPSLVPATAFPVSSSSNLLKAPQAATKLRDLNLDKVAKTKNEPLRLRRTKPVQGRTSNILEQVLGIASTSSTA